MGQLARHMGLSRATVSMALRNDPRVAAKTRRRVHEVARDLGWRPSPEVSVAMSAIRRHPVGVTLGWLNLGPDRTEKSYSYYYRNCLRGAAARAEALGYQLESFWIGKARDQAARLADILFARGITGVIVGPMPQSVAVDILWDRFVAVSVSYTLLSPTLNRVTDNHYYSARICTRRLLATSRERIGLAVSNIYDQRLHGLWTSGYSKEMLDAGRFDPALIFNPHEIDAQSLLRWVKEYRIDAIVAGEYWSVDWLRKGGIRVPEDIALTCLDLSDAAPEVAGTMQNHHQIGKIAIDLVASGLINNERGVPACAQTIIINSDWREGATVSDPAPANWSVEPVPLNV